MDEPPRLLSPAPGSTDEEQDVINMLNEVAVALVGFSLSRKYCSRCVLEAAVAALQDVAAMVQHKDDGKGVEVETHEAHRGH